MKRLAIAFLAIVFLPIHAQSKEPEGKRLTTDKLQVLLMEMSSTEPRVAGKASVEVLKRAEEINVSIVRGAMARAGKLMDWRAFPHLISILEEKENIPLSPLGRGQGEGQYLFDADTRALCALSIGNIFGNRGFEPQEKDNQEEKEPAFTGDNAVQALVRALSPQEDIRVRLASAQALGESCTPTTIPPLKAIVNDTNENPVLQIIAVRSLTQLYSCLVARNITPPDPAGDPSPYTLNITPPDTAGDPSPYPHITKDMMDRASAWALQFSNLLTLVPTKAEMEGAQ